jgi:predicted nuclease of predicted toxin-antitoxin system
MTLRFLIDENLPQQLADWMRSAGHDVVHVLDQNAGGTDDTKLASIAAESRRILVTRDADFSIRRKQSFQIVWIRFGNIRNRDLVTRLAQAFPEIEAALRRGDIFIEVA